MYRIWRIYQPNFKLREEISNNLNISNILSQLLINRNIEDTQSAESFLYPKFLDLSFSFLLPDMKKAVERIKKAIYNKERILIFGDYDVDGITAVALLESVLSNLGLRVFHYLPHRINEGYGLNTNVIRMAKSQNIHLLITVDCGITNFLEVEELNRVGIDVIITDHHLPLEDKLPSALAVVDPQCRSSKYPYKALAGVGVAYKLASALLGRELREYLDLVCMGTVADSMPLLGENRTIAKEGLFKLIESPRLGFKALLNVSRIEKKYLNTEDISYIIAPRLNASGRLDDAEISLKLLMSKSIQEANELAEILHNLNTSRQKIEEKMLKEAEDMVENEINFKEDKVIILAKEGWHQGLLGIVASKIKDTFHRPTVMISLQEGICRGSARSIRNFHILEMLSQCKDILNNFGGHSLAAGLSISKKNIQHLKKRLNDLASQKLNLEDLYPSLDIDMELKLKDISVELLDEIAIMEPFGEANPHPLFYTPKLKLSKEPQIFGKNHIKIWVTDGEFSYPAIGFNMANLKEFLENCESFDLVYSLPLKGYRNSEDLFLEIEDIRLNSLRP
ncbi:MAG: single-stranded-DNA-specific exonuclease RecJ [Candidatus Omnitrophica bacterium]|nr:single-stranded-DNA-specific exonuclease RecJ [Candidatus Omnitrophota bacterium]MCM8799376.1 single-stranded-DNA-specific exonuclease RecJ [Candidatus Omnitrophota bacterium]